MVHRGGWRVRITIVLTLQFDSIEALTGGHPRGCVSVHTRGAGHDRGCKKIE